MAKKLTAKTATKTNKKVKQNKYFEEFDNASKQTEDSVSKDDKINETIEEYNFINQDDSLYVKDNCQEETQTKNDVIEDTVDETEPIKETAMEAKEPPKPMPNKPYRHFGLIYGE